MKAPLSHRRGRSRQLGLAVVESAIILPLVLFMMFAVAEIGRAIGQHNSLTKSVRDGVRAVANSSTDLNGKPILTAAQLTAARNLVVFGNPAGTGAPLLPGLSVDQVSVTVDPADLITCVSLPTTPSSLCWRQYQLSVWEGIGRG